MSNDDMDGNVYARSKANLAAMKLRFPKQFDCQHIGRDWPDGWNHLVTRVCETADESGLPIRWIQVKEKWAGLRLYWQGQPFRMDFVSPEGRGSFHHGEVDPAFNPIRTLIAEMEEESLRTCAKCSAPGHEVNFSGWLLTVCDDCRPRIESYKKRPARNDDEGL